MMLSTAVTNLAIKRANLKVEKSQSYNFTVDLNMCTFGAETVDLLALLHHYY